MKAGCYDSGMAQTPASRPRFVQTRTATFQTQDELNTALVGLFTANFSYFYKAGAFHWNTVGFDFPEFHSFFGEVYDTAEGAIDSLAEWLRRFDADAPQMLSNVGQDGAVIKDFKQGVEVLLSDSEAFIQMLKDASVIAAALNEQGVLNFFADLMDKHQKLRWKYRSILAGEAAPAPAPAAAAPEAAPAPAAAPAAGQPAAAPAAARSRAARGRVDRRPSQR